VCVHSCLFFSLINCSFICPLYLHVTNQRKTTNEVFAPGHVRVEKQELRRVWNVFDKWCGITFCLGHHSRVCPTVHRICNGRLVGFRWDECCGRGMRNAFDEKTGAGCRVCVKMGASKIMRSLGTRIDVIYHCVLQLFWCMYILYLPCVHTFCTYSTYCTYNQLLDMFLSLFPYVLRTCFSCCSEPCYICFKTELQRQRFMLSVRSRLLAWLFTSIANLYSSIWFAMRRGKVWPAFLCLMWLFFIHGGIRWCATEEMIYRQLFFLLPVTPNGLNPGAIIVAINRANTSRHQIVPLLYFWLFMLLFCLW